MKERLNEVDVYLRQLEGSPKEWEETLSITCAKIILN